MNIKLIFTAKMGKYLDVFIYSQIDVLLKDNYIQKVDIKNILE